MCYNLPMKSKYQIRKNGKCYCGFDDKNLMYSDETLKSMRAAGYKLYIDGKLHRNNSKNLKKQKDG